MPCNICGAAVKNPSTQAHIGSKRHQTALKPPGAEKTTFQTITKSTSSGVENRLLDLERQMKYVITKLNSMEQKLSNSTSAKSLISKGEINKMSITRLVPRGNSINLDDLEKELKQYSWDDINNTLRELVDDEEFDVVEAKSKRKLYGRFGRIIRR